MGAILAAVTVLVAGGRGSGLWAWNSGTGGMGPVSGPMSPAPLTPLGAAPRMGGMRSLVRRAGQQLLVLPGVGLAGRLTLASLLIGSLGLSALVGGIAGGVVGGVHGLSPAVVLEMLLGFVALATGWRWWRAARSSERP